MAITRRHGSWVVLGVLVTDADLAATHADPETAAWDACGECRACIDACPTGAIVEDGVLDARRCLSYLSQSRLEELPFAEAFEDRVYGCDICQDVCPWNRGAERRAAGLEPDDVDDVFPRLADWLESSADAARRALPQALRPRPRRTPPPAQRPRRAGERQPRAGSGSAVVSSDSAWSRTASRSQSGPSTSAWPRCDSTLESSQRTEPYGTVATAPPSAAGSIDVGRSSSSSAVCPV